MSRRGDPEAETPTAETPTDETSGTSEPSAPAAVVARRDFLGRPVETVAVADLVAASHWRESDWWPVR